MRQLITLVTLVTIVLLAAAARGGAPGHGYAAQRLRLSFGDSGTIELYDVQRSRSSLAEWPTPGLDPSNPLRGTALLALRTPSASAQWSSMTYRFRDGEAMPEVHIGFRMYIQHHPDMDGQSSLQFLQLRDTSEAEMFKAFNGAGGSWFQLGPAPTGYQLSTSVPPRTSVRVRLHYRAADPGESNGILKAWLDGAPVLDRNDHAFEQSVQEIVLRCRSGAPL
ncbi:MAG: hypothetical protein ACYTGP_12990, partial [Planctomycetota bacterium]